VSPVIAEPAISRDVDAATAIRPGTDLAMGDPIALMEATPPTSAHRPRRSSRAATRPHPPTGTTPNRGGLNPGDPRHNDALRTVTSARAERAATDEPAAMQQAHFEHLSVAQLPTRAT
jgi:hypothetical protein